MFNNNFESLSQNKLEFCKRLSQDEDLAKCLLCKDKNFKDYILKEDDIDNLVFSQIFPCKKIIDTQTEANSYITTKFKYTPSPKSGVWKVGELTFFIFCHISLMHTNYGVLRHDYMLQRVNSLVFNTRNESWLGKLSLKSMDEDFITSDGSYYGNVITYRSTEVM